MSPFHKITSATAALALLALPACSALTDAEHGATQKLTAADVVEKVNGVPITRSDLDRAVKALMAQNRMPQQVPADVVKKATEAALTQLTAAELLYQAGAKLEIKDLDKQVSSRIAQAKYQYPSQAEFEKALKSVNMTQKDMEEAARKDIVINNLIEKEYSGQATVSEDEVKKFYDENRDKNFTHGETIKVSHILISVPEKASAEVKKQAKDKALALLKRVKGGEDFAAVAKAESTSPTKEQGGDLGIVSKGQTLPAFEKAAFALKAGEMSDVVETPLGYHIIKVAQRFPASTDKLEDVKGKIVGFLKREKIRKAVNAGIDQLRAKAKIEKV